MTQLTSANLRDALDAIIKETEDSLDHSMLDEDRIFLHKTLTQFVINGSKKFVKGSIEHSDGVTPFIKSINAAKELGLESYDTVFYTAAILEQISVSRGSAQ